MNCHRTISGLMVITPVALLCALLALMATTPNHAQAAPQPQKTPAQGQAADVLIGQLRFADNEAVAAGDFALELARMPQPPTDTHYELWLQSQRVSY